MTHTVEATYEAGVLKLASPLPLKPNEKVRVTVETNTPGIMESYGILGWKGDHETLRKFAEDSELDPQESA